MAKIEILVTQEMHYKLEIDTDGYTDNGSLSELRELFSSIKESPMKFIEDDGLSTVEVGEITSRSVTVTE